METIPAAVQDDSSSANPSSVKSDDSSPRNEGCRGSPPPNCAICLGTCRNKSFTDSCLHQFCFKCLLTWSRVKAVCPLCKQNFRSIIHNVRSNHQYEEYMVEQQPPEEPAHRIDIDSLVTRRFRYRTTLTLPRRETLAFQQLLMHHYPMVAEVFPPPSPTPRRRSPHSFRRSVYRYNLWARPLPDFTGRFRDCTPEFYRYNSSQMHRLVPWLNRELHYLLNENDGHISYVVARILELLPQYHINSTEFREEMTRYFGERTEHFLHELYCFASTPYDMTGYDRHVQYTTNNRIMTMVNEVISSSESEATVDSDIVMVSSSEPAEPPAGPSRVPAPVYPQNYIPEPSTARDNVIPIETISHSDTDDDSSEVMVVGYIKPPQDRTPEVVDLLGSDSDVIVQENSPERPRNSAPEARPPLIVKLKLQKQSDRALPAAPSESDEQSDGSTYTPPPRRCPHAGDAYATPPPPTADGWSSSYSPSSCSPSSPSSRSYYSSSTASSISSSDTEESPRRRRRRKSTSPDRHKRRSKRPSRSHHRSKKVKPSSSRDKHSKRKSHSGKGVKSTKSRSEASTSRAAEELRPVSAEPGTSGLAGRRKRKRDRAHDRRSSRESKRLRSVVNVVSSRRDDSASPLRAAGENRNENQSNIPHNNTSDIGSQVEVEVCARDEEADNTDSDDLPLNLSVGKSIMSSSKM
ncbi:E3 ubiquitin-protein ligase Topors-like [Aricia agestis]|uniref:E3 ubiquitin-protein ligase Topors-like n=1 Tax=Aricia agestis TaxID=91739 RepID=UPI001C209ED6|nr:E3 ubiquitin-protein ligase Topors-like [Aricia agestis]XP_041974839.1 E3 ubiquitin-protein ligase Topors-like [Aricia agestis]